MDRKTISGRWPHFQKLIYKFNESSSKVPASSFIEMSRLILKSTGKHSELSIVKIILKRTKL